MDDLQLPVACALPDDALARRRCDLADLVRHRVTDTRQRADGYTLTIDAAETGALAEIATMIERERDCCPFLRFRLTVDPAHGPVTLDLTGPPGTAELLTGLLFGES